MTRFRLALPALFAAAALACQAPSASTAASPEPAVGSLEASSLEELLAAFVASGGGPSLTYDQEVRELLASIPVRRVGPASTPVLLIGRPEVATAETSFEVLPLRFAVAEELADTLSRLVADARTGGAAGEPAIDLLADARTNSLLVRADAANLERVRALVARLDVEQL